jgi:hypothetical protein
MTPPVFRDEPTGAARAAAIKHLEPARQVLTGGDRRRLTLTVGAAPAGTRPIERYAAVPSLADPRALLPLHATGPALRTVLRQHAAGAASPAARGAAGALLAASRIGLAAPLLRGEVTLAGAEGVEESALHGLLADILGRRDFVTSLRLAPGRPNGKPVVQVVAADGEVLAYAKFGWDDLTRRLVRREGTTISELERLTVGLPLHVPRILYRGDWNGLEALVLAPLSHMGRSPRRPSRLPIAASIALAGMRPRSVEPLGASKFWRRMATQAKECAPALRPPSTDAALMACDLVESRWGDLPIALGQTHGDWIPPNIALRTDGAFNIWDWEHGVADGPLGLDAMQFLLFVALNRRTPDRAFARRLLRDAETALPHLGIHPGIALPSLVLSLLGSLLWFAEALAAGRAGQEDSRFAAALAVFLDEAGRSDRLAAVGPKTPRAQAAAQSEAAATLQTGPGGRPARGASA